MVRFGNWPISDSGEMPLSETYSCLTVRAPNGNVAARYGERGAWVDLSQILKPVGVGHCSSRIATPQGRNDVVAPFATAAPVNTSVACACG